MTPPSTPSPTLHPVTNASDLTSPNGLTLEDYISVAEEAVQRGHAGAAHQWVMPERSDYPRCYENPDYWAAMAPVNDYAHAVLEHAGSPHPHLRVTSGGWHIDQDGSQGCTDGLNWIELRNPATTITILHECAHVLRGSGRGHDPEFVTTLSGLLESHVSPAAADQFMRLVTHHPAINGKATP